MTPDEARSLYESGMKVQHIADQAGVSWTTVKRWVEPGYRERERANAKPRKERQIGQLTAELTETRVELANTKQRLAAARNLASRYRNLLEKERQAKVPHPAESLSELHAYWVLKYSPEEIERIAAGLSGWELDEVREAA